MQTTELVKKTIQYRKKLVQLYKDWEVCFLKLTKPLSPEEILEYVWVCVSVWDFYTACIELDRLRWRLIGFGLQDSEYFRLTCNQIKELQTFRNSSDSIISDPFGYSIARDLHKKGKYKEAFFRAKKAGKARKVACEFHFDKTIPLQQLFEECISDKPSFGIFNEFVQPIFLIGFPRSGTTLIETFFFPLRNKIEILDEFNFLLEDIEMVKYWNNIFHFVKNKRILSKAHSLVHRVGEIYNAFPRSQFIFVKRNRVDTFVSAFIRGFQKSWAFTCDVDQLILYMKLYDKLIDYWVSKLPPQNTLLIQYEEFISDPCQHMNRISQKLNLLDIEGIDWEKRRLDEIEKLTPFEKIILPNQEALCPLRKNYNKSSNEAYLKILRDEGLEDIANWLDE